MKYFQQGDVLLKKVALVPNDLIIVNEHKVLQDGEMTGHQHKFDFDNPNVILFIDPIFKEDTKRITPASRKFIIVKGKGAELKHEEHKPIWIEPGIYEIDIVREYDYDSMKERRVID